MNEGGIVQFATAECSLKIFDNFKDEKKDLAVKAIEKRITVKESNKKSGLFHKKLSKIAIISRIISFAKTLAILPCSWLRPYYGLFIVIELLGFCSAKNLVKKLIITFIIFLLFALCFRVYFLITLFNELNDSNKIKTTFIQTSLGLLIFSVILDSFQFFLSISIYNIISRYSRTGIQNLVKIVK